jgi:hypothetical protein
MSAQESRSEGSTSERLSKDTIFSILSNQRRRYVLYYLTRRQESVALRDLAEQVAAWENDLTVEELNYKQRKRVYTSLHQTHLPKLDDADVIDYDRNRGTIALDERSTDLDVYMEVVGEHDLPWCDFYLGLSTVVLLVVIAAWLGVFPFSLVPDLAIAGVTVGLFGLSAAVHSYLARRSRIGGGDAPVDVPED